MFQLMFADWVILGSVLLLALSNEPRLFDRDIDVCFGLNVHREMGRAAQGCLRDEDEKEVYTA
jgi:hypothetical protein